MKALLKERLAITKAAKAAIRNPYAWPGGYPLSIIMNDGEALCPDCAKAEWRQCCEETLKPGWNGWRMAGVEILWEGGNQCCQCNKSLDAYPNEEAGGMNAELDSALLSEMERASKMGGTES